MSCHVSIYLVRLSTESGWTFLLLQSTTSEIGKRESDCRAENVRYKPIKIAHPQHSHRIQPITAIFPLFSSNLKSTISLTFNISIWNLNPSTSYSLQHVCWVAWSRPVPLLTDRPPSTQSYLTSFKGLSSESKNNNFKQNGE